MFNKKNILVFLLGGLIFSSISVYASQILAKDISFTPKNPEWEINNLEDAINSLYENNSECIRGYYQYSDSSCASADGCIIEDKFEPSFFFLFNTNVNQHVEYSVLGGNTNYTPSNYTRHYYIKDGKLYAHNHDSNWANAKVFYIACK